MSLQDQNIMHLQKEMERDDVHEAKMEIPLY
jgi:hypothetical protein